MESSERSASPWLSLRDVKVVHRNGVLLQCVEFDIRQGELHVLTGKQGGGKTLLCGVLLGNETASGRVVIAGKAYPRFTRGLARKAGIEAIGLSPQVFPHLTVTENIAMSLNRSPNRYWLGKRALCRKVAQWVEDLGVRDLPLDPALGKLPAPEYLFVQLLSALFTRPHLLVLDETLENLPANRREQTMAILRRELATGMSVLWATHQLEEGWRLADRLTIVRHGKILLTDLPGNIDRRSLLRLAYAQFPESEQDDRDRERFFNLVLYTEALLRDLPLAIAIVDSQGAVQFVNRAGRALLPGFDGAVIGTTTVRELLTGPNAGPGRTLDRVISGGGRQGEHAVSFTSPNGEITIDYQAQAIVDGSVTIGAMLMVQDVSERERLRSRLVLSHNISSVGLLAAGVAHDVNNPLSAIGNYLTYLMRKLPEGEARDTAARAGEEARNIQNIIDNLIAFSGNFQNDLDSVDLYALAGDLCALLRFNAANAGIDLLAIQPPDGVEASMLADVKEMRQLLLNLIRNAMEAMPGGGMVRVDFSESTRETIVIRIRDNGPGIALEHKRDIFEPFVSTKSGDDRYHGIGLTIVFSLVEKYRGAIDVENIIEGGCQFTLRFPASC